jgi:hypothetical protein
MWDLIFFFFNVHSSNPSLNSISFVKKGELKDVIEKTKEGKKW